MIGSAERNDRERIVLPDRRHATRDQMGRVWIRGATRATGQVANLESLRGTGSKAGHFGAVACADSNRKNFSLVAGLSSHALAAVANRDASLVPVGCPTNRDKRVTPASKLSRSIAGFRWRWIEPCLCRFIAGVDVSQPR